MEKVFLVAAFLVCSTSAFLFGSDPDWNGLVVKFGLNPFDSFYDMPRTQTDAESAGWTQMPDTDCNNNGHFRGLRFLKDNDTAVILLFDVNGYIAGIQCGIPKTSATAGYPPSKQQGQMFQEDGDRWTLTAYFTNPADICSSGRRENDFELEGTGSNLYLQNGSDPVASSILIPKMESNVTSVWTRGECFRFMGMHYWYSVSRDMSCDDFQPVFLLYNGGKLNAFGWALGLNLASSIYEHPPKNMIDRFMNPVPRCLTKDYGELSTLHIYMTHRPSRNWC